MDKNLNTTLVRGLQTFAHGAYYGKRDDLIEMPSVVANELAAAGLVVTVTEKTRATSTRKAAEATAPAVAEEPAATPTAQPKEDAPAPALKAAATAHNKMQKPLPNKAK